MSRLLTWFSTKNGKRFTRSCVGIAIASAFSFQIAINGPCLEKYREIFQIYRFGKEKPLSAEVQGLVQDVLNQCKISEEEKKKLRFFNVVGHNVTHAGGTNSPWGAAIGIPFTFEKAEEVDFSQLKIVGKEEIDWIVDGQELMEALIISDKAKKFALMREIYSCDFLPVLENSALAAFCVFLPAEFIRKINMTSSNFRKWSFLRRSIFYSVLYGFGFALYKCLHDPLKHLNDLKCDKLSAEAGPDYLEGGIEFYAKSLEKNQALRQLLGPRGKKMFTEKGNEEYYIFPPRLPLSKRLDTLRKMKQAQEDTNVSTQK
ncbi:transmembrane protein 177-like [Uloborus diversus]|uniref:transmembrane protein 177-like n=1 Tax=Uloborus diversus TaxID=327109 RepID=UPI00240A0CE0|nr:transmembrane protein 177-like [Uloborus diversus]XP_054724358.1 transmembrane protein 177-like [Uloborus diversus]